MPVAPEKPQVPHPALHPHFSDLGEKQAFLRRVFDDSAKHYERIASWGFLGTGGWYRRQALARAGLRPGMRVADIAAGTGITARAAAALAGDPALVTCVDPSGGMLRESRRRLPAARHVQAGADAVPLADATFDLLSMGFALRHVESLDMAFGEFARILRPGGRLLIMDITRPEGNTAYRLARLYFRDLMPRLTGIVTGSRQARQLMEYYWETLDRMVEPACVLAALRQAGFEMPDRHVEAGIFSEYRAVKPSA